MGDASGSSWPASAGPGGQQCEGAATPVGQFLGTKGLLEGARGIHLPPAPNHDSPGPFVCAISSTFTWGWGETRLHP